MLFEKYIQKGTMRITKRILGTILFILGLCFLFTFQKIVIQIQKYNYAGIIFSLVLIVAGYFLFISGRRG